jgi:hypothetical protein
MRAAWLLPALLLSPLRALADDYPLAPVKVVLRAEPGRLVAEIASNSVFWIEEVARLSPMPARDWPPEAAARVEAYVNEHLRLKADRAPLKGRLISGRFAQLPWEVQEQGRFLLRLAYDGFGADGNLNGEADFFSDYLEELKTEAPELYAAKKPLMLTNLTIIGRETVHFSLTPESPSFSVPVASVRRGKLSRALECVKLGFLSAFQTSSAWPAVAALILALGAAPAPKSLAPAAAVLLSAAFPTPAWLPWAAGILAAVSAGWPSPVSPVLNAAAAAGLGAAWLRAARPLLPREVPGAMELSSATAGIVIAMAVWLGVGLAASAFERRRLRSESESHADILYSRRCRLAATVLLVLCGGGLAVSLGGGR